MNKHRYEQLYLTPQIVRWLLIAAAVGLMAGTASAGFLVSLDWATKWREDHVWVIALLPLGGFLVGWVYHRFGRSVEAGNNLLLDEIHDPQKVVPLRMTPLVLFGSVATHLFGGSAGREGTAVQMAGSLADRLTKPLRLSPEDRRILLMAGISAGFASVFGTPQAGAIFGIEVLAIGKLRYDAIFPCFIAAILGDLVTKAWGIHHALYSFPILPKLTVTGLLTAILAGALFGVTGMIFSRLTHSLQRSFKKWIAYAPFRPMAGGALVAIAVLALGTTKCIGLGLPTIAAAFHQPAVPWDFLIKLALTALTLAAGFKGGEVTPLFFIGATLGSALSLVLPLPTALLSGMGFVAVFAGAANTPLASTFMAIELFGPQAGLYAGVACVASYLFSGHAGIYHAQRIGAAKSPQPATIEGVSLARLDEFRRRRPLIELKKHLHFLGFFTADLETLDMSHLAVLRLYCQFNARAPHTGFWSRLTAPTLTGHLAGLAKKAGIFQVVRHRVTLGYLNGGAIRLDISEVPPETLLQCLELMDKEDRLRAFLEAHSGEMKNVRAVLMRCEEPLVDQLLTDEEEEAEESVA